jgi:hypothetical protein
VEVRDDEIDPKKASQFRSDQIGHYQTKHWMIFVKKENLNFKLFCCSEDIKVYAAFIFLLIFTAVVVYAKV